MQLGIYKHYKGNLYRVLGVAKHSETLAEMVVYEALYENEVSKLWVRPKKMFEETVELEGKTVPRFKYLGPDKATIRRQRIIDYQESTGFISASENFLTVGSECLRVAEKEKVRNLVLPDGNHYTTWAIPALILFVNAFEVFLNELISLFSFDKLISPKEKARVGDFNLKEKLTWVKKFINELGTSNITGTQLDDFHLIVELRNDLIHYLPRNKYTDSVNQSLDQKGLLIPDNVLGRKHASYNLAQWICCCISQLVTSVTKDLSNLSVEKSQKAFFTISHAPTLRDNFIKMCR